MIKKIIFISLLVIFMLGVSACGTNEPVVDEPVVDEPVVDEPIVIELEYTEEGIITPAIAEAIIQVTSDDLINAIKDKDFNTIANFTHPNKGVRFTPYTYVSVADDIVFNSTQIQGFFNDQTVYLWGNYDGSGEDINLTPDDYYDRFIYTADYVNAEQIGYNEVLSFGNMIENQFEVYNDAIVVEYYFSGFDLQYEGIDWSSLRLVFEEYNGTWLLVGIIHNQWTI